MVWEGAGRCHPPRRQVRQVRGEGFSAPLAAVPEAMKAAQTVGVLAVEGEVRMRVGEAACSSLCVLSPSECHSVCLIPTACQPDYC